MSTPTVATANPEFNTPCWVWLLCWKIIFRRQIWSCCLEPNITVIPGVGGRCKFLHPPLPLLINYHHLPLSFVTLVIYLSPLLTNYHLSVLQPDTYSMKPLSDLTHSLEVLLDHLESSGGSTNDRGITYLSLLVSIYTTKGILMMRLNASYILRS